MEEEKETTLPKYPNMVSYDSSTKILEQMEKNMCKIKIGTKSGHWIFL